MKRTIHKIPIERGEGGQPFIKVFFDVFNDYYALIDTGSEHSFIDASIYPRKDCMYKTIKISGSSGVGVDMRVSEEYISILAFDTKHKISYMNTTVLSVDDFGAFNLMSRQLPEDAYENDRCCMIIGCDVLREMNAIIDLETNTLTLFDGYDSSDE